MGRTMADVLKIMKDGEDSVLTQRFLLPQAKDDRFYKLALKDQFTG